MSTTMTLEEAMERVRAALTFQESVPNADPNVLMDAPTLRLILAEVARLRKLERADVDAARMRQIEAEAKSQAAEARAKRLEEALSVCLGHMTGGLDGDYRDCDPAELARAALTEGKK